MINVWWGDSYNTLHTKVTDLGTTTDSIDSKTTFIQSLLSDSVYFDEETSKLNLYDTSDPPVVVAHWLCYKSDGTTLATHLGQVAKRGPLVMGA